MKVILKSGTELAPIMVTGARRNIQGASRDVLSFVFAGDADLAAIDAVFTEDACESIRIIGDDNSENIHTGYTIRAGLGKESVAISTEDAENAAEYEDRITVMMAQRTYSETQLKENTALLTALLGE